MAAFLLVFFTVYGSLHAYFFWKVQASLGPLRWIRLALAGFLLLMVVAPVLVVRLERAGWFVAASMLAVVGYTWAAVLAWFFCVNVLGDLWNTLARLVVYLAPQQSNFRQALQAVILPRRGVLLASGVVIAVGLIWGWIEMMSIRLRPITIEVNAAAWDSAGLPEGRDSITIAQITDLHLGVHTAGRRLARTISLIQQAKPDIVVSTGDLVDSQFENIDAFAGRMATIEAPLGKYAVLGNHEFYAGLQDSLAFHREAGFRVLRGESVKPIPGLRLAGVDDPAGLRRGQAAFVDELAALSPADNTSVTVLLKHQPRVWEESLGRCAVQLSGHTHGGQLFPWHFITKATYPYYRGLYELAGGFRLYVSPGTGTWGPPLRVLARPEVTLVTLRRDNSDRSASSAKK